MYESPHHGTFPKLQILTTEGLLSGKGRAQYPDMAYGAQTFKRHYSKFLNIKLAAFEPKSGVLDEVEWFQPKL